MIFPNGEPIPLWEGPAPLAQGNGPEDIPTITFYIPAEWKRRDKAVIVFPGGGYNHLAEHEGKGYAAFLTDAGYPVFVVHYRLGEKYRNPAQLSDAARAVRLVRRHASGLGIRPDRIGVMGSSAGGHLAAMCATFHEEGLRLRDEPRETDDSRPDFTVLCYPVISFSPGLGHEGSMKKLLGPEPDPALREKYSMEKSADAHTPRAFLFHTWADSVVPVGNSLLYALRLKQMGVPCDLHVYERCGHGIGYAGGHPWDGELLRWLDLL